MAPVGAQGNTEEESDFGWIHRKSTSDTIPGSMAYPD